MLKLIILCCVTDVPEAADAYQVDCRVLDLVLIMHSLTPARRCFVTKREKWCRILGADALVAGAEQLFVQFIVCFDFVQHLHSWSLARTAIGQITQLRQHI